MKKLIEALRLKYEANLSNERIAAACGMSKGAVHKYLALAKARNISWPLADDMDEGKLEALLFPAKSPPAEFEQPDCPQMHQELRRKGVTLQLLWSEYAAVHEHHDRVGGNKSRNMVSWNSSHGSLGCGLDDLPKSGGAGLFYCFATE